jgi:tetratricopeptide repeat protein 25
MPRKSVIDEQEIVTPESTFQSQAAEGDIMAKQGDFRKAIDAYTRVPTHLATAKSY